MYLTAPMHRSFASLKMTAIYIVNLRDTTLVVSENSSANRSLTSAAKAAAEDKTLIAALKALRPPNSGQRRLFSGLLDLSNTKDTNEHEGTIHDCLRVHLCLGWLI
jgi:hypothetical protein